jgi:Fe2+ transport system protein FeoA
MRQGQPHTPDVKALPQVVAASVSPPDSIPLIALRRGDIVRVARLAAESSAALSIEERDLMIARLRDLGFVAGARCEVLARMWLGGDPLVVRIGGSTFALRRAEAAAVLVQRLEARATAA